VRCDGAFKRPKRRIQRHGLGYPHMTQMTQISVSALMLLEYTVERTAARTRRGLATCQVSKK
jgi:hypothetical protein